MVFLAVVEDAVTFVAVTFAAVVVVAVAVVVVNSACDVAAVESLSFG